MTKNKQPQPVETMAQASDAAANNVLPMQAGAGTRRSIFREAATTVSKEVEGKMAMLSEVRQRLAEAKDGLRDGETANSAAKEIADNAAHRLYQARTANILSGEELSSLLGDIFGFKVTKSTGKPSKTPDGEGEHIRKRIVRAVNAHNQLVQPLDDGYFAGMGADTSDDDGNTLGEVVARLDSGDLSLYTAYHYFGTIRRAQLERTEPAFDPKKIAAIVAALSVDGVAAKFTDNPGLVAAYAALIEQVEIIGEQAAILAEAEAA